MKEKVRNIYDYDPAQAFEHIPGKSETVPCEATDLKELVRRSMLVGRFDFPPVEEGQDEDFDDAFEAGQDLSDYSENLSFIERYSARVKEAREKAAKAKIKSFDDTSIASPTSDTGVKENAPGEV